MTDKVYITLSLDLVNFFVYNLKWDTTEYILIDKEKSEELVGILCKIYKLPEMTIKKNYYLQELFNVFYEYLIFKKKAKRQHDFVKSYISDLKREIKRYNTNLNLASEIPEKLSYWDNGRFVALKGYTILHLFVYERYRLITLIKNLVSRDLDCAKLLFNFSRNNTPDYMIFKELRKLKVGGCSDREARAKSKIKNISELLKYDFVSIKKNKKYVDIGGGDGSISHAVGKALDLDKKSIISADVSKIFSVNEKRDIEDITYITLEKDSLLPFKSNEMFMVSAFMVLHHLPDINVSLSEIKRILTEGGFALIREHDCRNINDKMLMDLEHRIYEHVIEEEEKEIEFEKYKGKIYDCGYTDVNFYRSKEIWDNLFEEHGFEKVNIKFHEKLEKFNPTNYYYVLYKKL